MSKETLGIILAIVVGVVGFAISLADRSGKSTPTLTVVVLLIMTGLCLCGVYLIPWVWDTQRLAEQAWRILLVTTVVLIAVGRFGIWVWPTEHRESRPSQEIKKQELPFYIGVGPAMNTDKRDSLGYMVTAFERKRGEYTIVPINVWLYISLTNLQPVQSMIDAYRVEMRTKNGKWITLTRIDTRNSQFYAIQNGLDRARLLELVRLDSLLSFRWLLPKENVMGWLCFEYPPESDSDGFDFAFRVSVIDTARVQFQSDVLTVEGNDRIQGAMIEVKAQIVDLSKADRKYAN